MGVRENDETRKEKKRKSEMREKRKTKKEKRKRRKRRRENQREGPKKRKRINQRRKFSIGSGKKDVLGAKRTRSKQEALGVRFVLPPYILRHGAIPLDSRLYDT